MLEQNECYVINSRRRHGISIHYDAESIVENIIDAVAKEYASIKKRIDQGEYYEVRND